MAVLTSRVVQHADPRTWNEHRYGLSSDRWRTLCGSGFWVTGAGTGFGRALAVALGCGGARVFITGRRRSKLEETVEEAQLFGAERANFFIVPADVTSEQEITLAVETIARTQSPLRGVVNSAAWPQIKRKEWPLTDESKDSWTRILDTNVLGSWLVTKTALPLMVKSGVVRALFLTSEAGWASTAGFGQYNVSKAAVNSLGASMAEECAARHPDVDVQMNIVVPGEARTEMNQGSADSPYTLASVALLLLSHPAGGPNGKFFHRDGRHLAFAYSTAYTERISDK